MPSTIKDVARKANVSTATVSLVLHDHKRISQNTRNKVLKAISELNYTPSRVARGLVLKETKNIGFILTNDHFLRTEPFYTHIFLGTEFEARDYEYYVLLSTIPEDFDKCKHLPRFVLEKNIDGVIIAGKVPNEIFSCLESFNIPFVFSDYYPATGEYSAVLIDNVDGGKKATEYLIANNHKNIGFIGGDMNHPSIHDRFQGYKFALEKAGIEYNAANVITRETSTTRQSGYHAASELAAQDKNITAIFAANDAMAIGALQYYNEKNLMVPDDISLVGFDDLTTDLFTDPPLSSIRVPKIDLGAEATRILIDMLKRKVTSAKKVLVPVELIERKSVKRLGA
jgi:LacI family transcriptional regulator